MAIEITDIKSILERCSTSTIVEIPPYSLNRADDLEAIAKALSQNINITKFIINGQGNQSNINATGVKALSHALSNKPELTFVEIVFVDLTNIFAEFVSFLEALKTNLRLSTLILSITSQENRLNGAILQSVFSNPWLRNLTLKATENFFGNGLTLLKTNKILNSITIAVETGGNNTSMVGSGLADGLSDTSLMTVNYNGDFCPELATAIKGSHTLLAFIHSGGKIDERSAIILGGTLEKNKTLKTLRLNNVCGGGGSLNGMDAGIVAIAKALETNIVLENVELVIQDCFFKGAEALSEALNVSRAISKLTIGITNADTYTLLGYHMGDKTIQSLAPGLVKNSSLVELNISGTVWQSAALLAALESNNKLKKLTGLVDRNSEALINFVKRNSCLEELTIKLTHDQANDKNFAESLRTNMALRRLVISVDSGGGGTGTAIASATAEALRSNNVLQSVSITCLGCCNPAINNPVVKEFHDALKTNTTIIDLTLQSAYSSPMTTSEIQGFLTRNRKMRMAGDISESLHDAKADSHGGIPIQIAQIILGYYYEDIDELNYAISVADEVFSTRCSVKAQLNTLPQFRNSVVSTSNISAKIDKPIPTNKK